MNDLTAPQAFPTASLDVFVPSSYAEKAMASLLQLHGELMEEKERRVDLYRRLMEKEQAIAELKMYVKLLEEKIEAQKAAPGPQPIAVCAPTTAAPLPRVETAKIPGPGFPAAAKAKPRVDHGWKGW